MILWTECCETSAQISVGRSKLKDKCSKTLMCILSSMPSRADKSIKWQRKATSIMFDRSTGWGLTCHRAVIYSLALLHRKGWRETSLTLKQFCAEGHWWDEKNAKFLKISSTAGCLGNSFQNIIGRSAVRSSAVMWQNTEQDRPLYWCVCLFWNEFILLSKFEPVALLLTSSIEAIFQSRNLLIQNW